MNILINFQKIKNNFIKKENIFFLFFALIIFLFDRITKLKILNNFSDKTFFINDYLNIDLIWNVGIGFGLLSSDSNLFYHLTSALIGTIILILAYFFAVSEKIDKLIYSLIIGGALGNFCDRIVYKAVPDFIDLHYDNFHWFTFNVADIFISMGIIFFLIRSFFIKEMK
jgi:signal peptidase II